MLCRTVDSTVFKPVVALCCATNCGSASIHLIAVSECGVRFYFSTVPMAGNQQAMMQQEQNSPQGLYLLHVRMPPGYTVNPLTGKPKQVHSTICCYGSFLMVSTPQQDQDLLWSISSEPFATNRNSFTECSTTLQLDGHVWAMAEYKDKHQPAGKSYQRDSINSCKVILLTNQGVHIVSLAKPVTLLQQLFQTCHGPHHEAVKAYFKVRVK
jgi:nuclear pore complex protein Nup155